MSVGSLYQYYPNKDALLAELMRAHVAEGTEAIRRRMTEAALTPGGGRAGGLADRLRPFVAAAIDNHRADPDLHRVLFEEAPRPAAVLAELHALEARPPGPRRIRRRAGADAGRLPQPARMRTRTSASSATMATRAISAVRWTGGPAAPGSLLSST